MVSAIILARENRVMINDIKKDIGDVNTKIGKLFTKVDESANHLSKRLPGWATAVITILGALVTGLIVAAVK